MRLQLSLGLEQQRKQRLKFSSLPERVNLRKFFHHVFGSFDELQPPEDNQKRLYGWFLYAQGLVAEG